MKGEKIMPQKIMDFSEEITDKFSELFVETFLIRYLNAFRGKDLLEAVKETNDLLKQKINNLFVFKLVEMGYDSKELKKYLK